MAKVTPKSVGQGAHERERMMHAFGLLASAELGRSPDWNGSDDLPSLRARTEVLAILLNIVPRSEINRLDDVIEAWGWEFPPGQSAATTELRESARRILKPETVTSDPSILDENSFRRAIELSRSREKLVEPFASPEPWVNEFSDKQAQQQCAFGLGIWLAQVANHRGWRYLPAIVPGEGAAEIDKAYVELYAISDEDAAEFRDADGDLPRRLSRRMLANEYPVVSVPTMIARTMQLCIVMGEPGSGKSTLVQWLAWATHNNQCPDFDVALVVKLGAFATALAERPTSSLIEFFFASLDTNIVDWRPGAYWLRRLAGEGHRFLLLLDGWDEVPVDLREVVRERVERERHAFVTVITSRPSGLPRQFSDGDGVDFYRIAGLAPGAIENFVRKRLFSIGNPELYEVILSRIQEEPDLREMAANPFLLGLLIRVLARVSDQAVAPRTLADVYRQITAWVQELHNQSCPEALRLTAEHIAGLRRVSHALLFEVDLPRYVFRSHELAERLSGYSSEPILRSRFVNRIDPVFDEFGFIHATFQEYFAAEWAGALLPPGLDDFLERAFRSASRLIVLEFIAGLDGLASARCRAKAAEWFGKRDRFQLALLRVARLASAGRWPVDDIGLGLREELWSQIHRNENMTLTKASVEALAELDPRDLARRARTTPGLDNWAIQCIVDAVPKSISAQECLDELMPVEWRDYAGFDARGGATDEELEVIRAQLDATTIPRDDLRTAIIHAGAARDAGAVLPLLNMLVSDFGDSDLQQQAMNSLGAIGSPEAVGALVDVVVGDRPLADESVSMAVEVLCHGGAKRGALDPNGRDRLVRRMAALSPSDKRLPGILMALEDYPLREGVVVIDYLARRTDANAAIRIAAVRALSGAMDRPLVQRFLSTIENEPVGEVAGWMLNVGVGRSLAVPLPWLESKLSTARDKVKRREYFTAYLMMLAHSSGKELNGAHDYLHRSVSRAMSDDSGAVELAGTLNQALDRVERYAGRLFSDETVRLSVDLIAKFSTTPSRVPESQVLLATKIVGRIRSAATRIELRKAFDAAQRWAREQKPDRLLQGLAAALAKVAPGELLHYPVECDEVRSTLCSLAVERGWLVFSDRILDAEGVEIARIDSPAGSDNGLPKPADLISLCKQLSPPQEKVLQSYWLMVKDDTPCRSSDTLKVIYAAVQARHRGETMDDLAEYLDSLYPDALPSFDTWRKTLNRIAKRFAAQSDMAAYLRRIGLGRQRKKC